MINIQQTYRKLGELLNKEKLSFNLSQKMQFDWLQSIEVQLDFFDVPSKSHDHRLSFEDPPKVKQENSDHQLCWKENDENNPSSINQNETNLGSLEKAELLEENDSESESTTSNLPMGNSHSATAPCFSNNSIHFVDDNSLLLDSSSSSDEESEIDNGPPVPYTLSSSVSELTQSATSFREKWLAMLHQKKASTSMPKKPFKFAFEEEEVSVPDVYKISESDDEDQDPDDEEIYDANPIEIHGKAIPSWARGDLLLKQLKKQQRIDPDSIFSEFTADSLDLPAVFNEHKAKWENRSDSGCWEHDRVTDEEIANLKSSLNIQ